MKKISLILCIIILFEFQNIRIFAKKNSTCIYQINAEIKQKTL